MTKKSIGFNAAINVIRTIFNILFPIVTYMYASRILGVENMGRFNTANSITQYIIFIANLGITNYILREGSKVRDNREAISKLFDEILIITLGAMCIAYVAMTLVVAVPMFANYRTLIVLLCTTVIFNTLGVEWLFQIYEDYTYITIRSIIFKVLSILLLFAFVKSESDLIVYTMIVVIGKVGSNICNIFQIPKYITIFNKGRKLEIRRHIKPIVIMFGIAMSTKIYVNLDQTMVGLMAGDHEAGLYATALQINDGVETLILAICMVVSPRLAYYYANKGKDNFEKLAYKTVRYTEFFAVPVSIWVFLLSRESILILSGESYIGATEICRILSWRILLGPVNYVLASQLLITLNKEKQSLIATITAAIVNLCLNWFLITQYGGAGAAFATILSEFVVCIMSLIFLRRHFCMEKIVKPVLLYGLAVAPTLGVDRIFANLFLNPLMKCTAVCLISGLIYCAILFLIKDEIIIEAKMQVQKIWKKRRGGYE